MDADRGGRRTTQVARADGRVKGLYEQTADWPNPRASHETVARMLGPLTVLRIDGMVAAPASLTYGDLVERATMDRFGIFSVAMPDLLALVRLDFDADLLILGTRDGQAVLVPVRDVLKRSSGSLMLGTSAGPLSVAGGFPARLDGAATAGSSEAWAVTSIEATVFGTIVR